MGWSGGADGFLLFLRGLNTFGLSVGHGSETQRGFLETLDGLDGFLVELFLGADGFALGGDAFIGAVGIEPIRIDIILKEDLEHFDQIFFMVFVDDGHHEFQAAV